MITDGKPTCLKIGKRYYKNSFGLDRGGSDQPLYEPGGNARNLQDPDHDLHDRYRYPSAEIRPGIYRNKTTERPFCLPRQTGAFIFKDFESGKRKQFTDEMDIEDQDPGTERRGLPANEYPRRSVAQPDLQAAEERSFSGHYRLRRQRYS